VPGELRREKPARSTTTLIDILVRKKIVEPKTIASSTLNRHLARLGLSRLALRRLGQKTFRRIETQVPFELVVGDFHHGPYVRAGEEGEGRRALLLCFIDTCRPLPTPTRSDPTSTATRTSDRPRPTAAPQQTVTESERFPDKNPGP